MILPDLITNGQLSSVMPAYDVIAVQDVGNSESLAMSAVDSVILFVRFDPRIVFELIKSDPAKSNRSVQSKDSYPFLIK